MEDSRNRLYRLAKSAYIKSIRNAPSSLVGLDEFDEGCLVRASLERIFPELVEQRDELHEIAYNLRSK